MLYNIGIKNEKNYCYRSQIYYIYSEVKSQEEGRIKVANKEIRELLRKYRIRHYEVAALLGINETTLCRWLRSELTPVKKNQIVDAINELTRQVTG